VKLLPQTYIEGETLMKKSALKIHPLDLGTLIDFEKSVFTIRQNQGVKVNAPCLACAILGAEKNVLVDSGPCSPETAMKYFKRTIVKSSNQELEPRCGTAPPVGQDGPGSSGKGSVPARGAFPQQIPTS
jgi:hypothetical protein